MDIKDLILRKIKKNGEVKASEVVKETGFSRAYVNRFFQELRDEGKIVLIGRANNARYIMASPEIIAKKKRELSKFHRIYKNTNLEEDGVLVDIKKETGIFLNLRKNVERALDYGFLEMMNNAIEHSMSDEVEVLMVRDSAAVRFDINDKGVGIFNNIARGKGLSNEMEAIQDLLKGKETTAPEAHSGEGIFFTSKIADTLIFRSGTKKLIFNNKLGDIFIQDIKKTKGTKVTFTIGLDSQIDMNSVFKEYTNEETYEFSKTKIVVNLYKAGTDFISRSQARRMFMGLDRFETIVLDFRDVDTVGQAFADEVFRVWQKKYPNIDISYRNANENVEFMIKRAL
ncbi:MAG: DUF4325 domain-containing protein [Candidatus Spechtbacterales bacterium]